MVEKGSGMAAPARRPTITRSRTGRPPTGLWRRLEPANRHNKPQGEGSESDEFAPGVVDRG